MNIRACVLIVAVILLLTQSGCASLHNGEIRSGRIHNPPAVNDFDAEWKKSEREWLLMVVAVLVVAIAAGAAISASSGGGLFIGIN
jgi:hypothetical protein